MITYNDIYEASRKERYSEQLQPLLKNFIEEVAVYLREKKEMASKDEDAFSDVTLKTKKQLENAITLFKELMLRRRKKMLTLVLVAGETGISKQDFENMLPMERDMFEEIMKIMDIGEKRLSETLNGKRNEEKKNTMLFFKTNVEEFLGFDGNNIGPFEKGQIANLPKEIAKILVDDGKAELVEE